MSDQAANDKRRLGQQAVEAALRNIAKLEIAPRAETPLRILLAYKAIWRDAPNNEPIDVDGTDVRRAVEELFTVVPGPPTLKGTVRLRGRNGRPDWITNDSHRGSFVDYPGPSNNGRFLFEGNDWHNRPRPDAVERVAKALGNGPKPPRDVLAALALRNEPLPNSLSWQDLIELARERYGLEHQEFDALTAPPAISDIDPFGGPEWDPAALSADLVDAGVDAAEKAEKTVHELAPHVAEQVERVLRALRKHGEHSIVALVGVPGTSKTHVARIAAEAFASEGCVRRMSFSPSLTYEQFMEGPTFAGPGQVEVVAGGFLELNTQAENAKDKQFVLLIDELTRADLPRVLGELMTYLEYRGEDDDFTSMYRRDRTLRIMDNIAILATYNPTDRSAVNLDDATLRRIEPLTFGPNVDLLDEMLRENGLPPEPVAQLAEMFEACRRRDPERFDEAMPFGHALFARVESEEDLGELWPKLRRIMVRPHAPAHPYYDLIREHYPWADNPDYRAASSHQPPSSGTPNDQPGAYAPSTEPDDRLEPPGPEDAIGSTSSA